MTSRGRLRAALIGALAIGMAVTSNSASAQPGVGGGGIDVLGDGGTGANVVVHGDYVQVPSSSLGSTGSPGASSAATGGAGSGYSGGGDGVAAPTGPPVRQQLKACSRFIDCTPTSPDVDLPATPVSMAQIMNTVGIAITAMQLEAPEMCWTPEPADFQGGRTGLVGRFGWGWICSDTGAAVRPSQVGPVSRTVPGPGGLLVNATAVNTGIAINFGDGDAIFCPGALLPFTPYTDVVDASPLTPPSGMPSPTCGHLIEKSSIGQPNGDRFNVSATSAWIVNWTVAYPGGGAGGVVPVPLTSTYRQRIGELQVLVTPN
ncbi:hypothetical protein EEB14_46910 [Rhodococcus sp. WS4]|nr:hypothetical protein EEB14_46910 [Rhodococcus sp. WS4]